MMRISPQHSIGEKGFMELLQRIKQTLFYPILQILNSFGLNAYKLSIAGSVIAVGSLLLSFIAKDPLYFVWGIWIHFVIDGLDGALARFQKTEGPLGAFADVLCDHLGIISSCVFLTLLFPLASSWALIFAVLYTVVMFCSFTLGALGKPMPFVFRPRIFIYAALTADVLGGFQFSPVALPVFSVVLFPFVVDGLARLGKVVKNRV